MFKSIIFAQKLNAEKPQKIAHFHSQTQATSVFFKSKKTTMKPLEVYFLKELLKSHLPLV